MIDRQSSLPIQAQAQLLGISRGTVYYLPAPTPAQDVALMKEMARLHLAHPFMGQRQLLRQLKRLGYEVGRLHVRTLMHRMGLRAMCPQPGSSTSTPAPGHTIYPYLLRGLAIQQANQVWALDTTYIPMQRGFVYLVAVLDVASRKVLAHKVATTLEACHAREVIEQAFARHGIAQIVNTDQGSQFTAKEFADAVLARGCQLSMDGRGAWRVDLGFCHNVFMERVWRTLKYEHVYKHVYASVAEARTQVGQYLAWYNAQRPHSSLNGQTPNEAYARLLPALQREASHIA
jgi:putative transposase